MHRKTTSVIWTIAIVAAAVMGLCACGGSGGAKSSMQQNLISSKAYRLSIHTDGSFTIATPTQTYDPVPTASAVEMVLRAAEAYDNGDIRVSFTFGKADYPMARGAVLRDLTFSARLSPSGRLSELSGTEEIRRHVQSLVKGGSAGSIGDPQLLLIHLHDDAILAMLNPILDFWPATPVAPGDTWTREPIYHPSPQVYEHTTFTLKSEGSSVARVLVESIYRLGVEPSSEQSGSATGEIQISPSLGVLRSSEIKSKLTWKAEGVGGLNTITNEQTTYVTFTPL